MLNKYLLTTILFLLSATTPLPISAENKVPQALIDSVVLLTANNSRCATGFITKDGILYTNAHVINSLCVARKCSNIKIKKASAIGRLADIELDIKNISVKAMSSMLDVAILESEEIKNSGTFELAGYPIKEKQAVSVLGFPGCKELAFSSGEVISSQTLRTYTSTDGAHGSSGSPLIDETGKVVGIVNQASSIAGGLGSLLFETKFKNRAVPISTISEVFTDIGSNASITTQVKLLNSFYKTELSKVLGLDRIRESLELSQRIRSLADDILNSEYISPETIYLTIAERDLIFLASLPWKKEFAELAKESQELAIYAAIESRGLLNQNFQKIERQELEEALKNSNHPTEQISKVLDIFESAEAQKNGGVYSMGTRYILPIIITVGGLFFIYSFTLGIVFSTAYGGFIKRIFKTALVGIALWPISFVIFLLFRRNKKIRPSAL
jgi:V8-like Glu-specific endopeptidase